MRCRRCRRRFDLLVAEVCGCAVERPTRRCAHCRACLCDEPIARDPEWWIDTPERLRVLGVGKMPVDYL